VNQNKIHLNLSKDVTNQLKGVAIIFVVLIHVGLSPKYISGVSIFIILSGFGLTQSYFSSGLKEFFEKRLTSIYYPYLIVTLIWILLDYILLRKVYGVESLLLNIAGLNVYPYIDSSMWFITYIIIWYVIFYLTFIFFKHPHLRLFLILTSGTFCFFTSNIISPSSGSSSYIFCFPIGVTIGYYYKWFQTKSTKKSFYFEIILFFIFCSGIFYMMQAEKGLYHLFENYHHNLINITLKKLSISFIAILLFSSLATYKILIKPLIFLGSISYEMYLVEGKIILYYFNNFQAITNPYIKGITAITTVIISALIFKYIFRFIQRILHNRLSLLNRPC